ncbi:MAG: dephospho-CoA kinase [Candidatus Omnitrophica bacterium]|nr:dephospho-CoA kinase [Candidatus Omnitrophota bacterium]MCM8793356.1 dephospho-CoA kinase [Candidatus Omnitrophota bacterium]
MVIVGITGNIGSGKSTVASYFSAYGAKVIDADKLVHRLLRVKTTVGENLVKSFGKGILDSHGGIDRKKLAKIAFANFRRWRLLCKIIHPEVIRIIKERIRKARKQKIKVLAIDAPLLIESRLDKLVDYIVLVKAEQKKAYQRTRLKMDISLEDFRRRIRFQLPFRKKLPFADFVVDNSKTIKFTERQVEEIWKKIIKKS